MSVFDWVCPNGVSLLNIARKMKTTMFNNLYAPLATSGVDTCRCWCPFLCFYLKVRTLLIPICTCHVILSNTYCSYVVFEQVCSQENGNNLKHTYT